MSKEKTIIISEYFDQFIDSEVKKGRYKSSDEVVTAALRLFERVEKKEEALILALEKGEQRGFVENFNSNEFLDELNRSLR